MNEDQLRQVVRAPAGESEPGSGSDSTSTLAQARQKISNTARGTAARIKSAAGETADRAKSEAERLANEKKQDTANRIGGYSNAIHESAKSLERQDPNIAWATHRIADRIQRAADYVRNSELDDLKRDAEDIARRHPVAFFGGLFIAGLVIGNLLKAHRPEADDEEGSDVGNASGSAEPMGDAPLATGI